jgi:hypothetical protein
VLTNPLVRWLVDHAAELFSGIGAIAVSGLVALIGRRVGGRRGEPLRGVVDAPAPAAPSLPSLPSGAHPDDVYRQLRQLPLLHQPDAAAAYVGTPLEFDGEIRAAEKHSDGRVRVQVASRPGGHDVFLWLDVADYPSLRLLKYGDRVHVRGEIDRIDASWIQLRRPTIAAPRAGG